MMEEYRNKKEFVEKLRDILQEADIAADIEYRNFPDKYEELIKVSFADHIYKYVNVTADSLLSIFVEIARVVNRQPACGEICDTKHIKLIDRWWADA